MIALHHVQVSCPPSGEDDARRFYAGALGLVEVEKPPALRGRGGVWFRAYDAEGGVVVAELHVGVEDRLTPARKAHPAFVVDDLDAVADACVSRGFEVDLTEHDTLEGYRRFHTSDPAGNRVELLAPRSALES